MKTITWIKNKGTRSHAFDLSHKGVNLLSVCRQHVAYKPRGPVPEEPKVKRCGNCKKLLTTPRREDRVMPTAVPDGKGNVVVFGVEP